MGDRLALHSELVGVTEHVYFQPPSNIQMQYPCIVYERNGMATYYANGNPYSKLKQYTLTIIDDDPDSEIPDKIAEMPTARFNRHFVSDNLNHDVFTIYF